eukprot:TRINITY_DN10277_c0_g1_i3.p1 TRINITY_DN10277_c0_g1~~TRINITY_DN10277_c0_g1_i3.p1  ORF type:complete len:605 (+),score=136.12 TRINITY_DN10277_c0_g1_i3:113-1816(+)
MCIRDSYDPDHCGVRLCLWKEGLESLDESRLEFVRMSVKRNNSNNGAMEWLSVLSKISEVTGIPFEKLRVYKRVQSYNYMNADELSSPENYEKSLSQVRVFENQILYVESVDSAELPSKWLGEFDKETNRLMIKFNTPAGSEPATTSELEYNNTVVLDMRDSVRTLKEAVATYLKLDMDKFIIKRGGKQGIEVKDLRQTINAAGFVNKSSVFVEFGVPTLPGQFRIGFSWAKRLAPTCDNALYEFEELFEMAVNGDQVPSEVKKQLCEKVKELNGTELDPKLIRLRERNSERLSRVYREKPLKTQNLYEKRQISLQVLEKEESLDEREHVILFKEWDPTTFDLSDWFEITVDRTLPLSTLAKKIAEQRPELKVENMMLTRVNALFTFSRLNLLDQEWLPINDEGQQIANHPFYISSDGLLFIVKDITKPQKQLTEEEAKTIGYVHREKPKKINYSDHKMRANIVEKEKGLKITVKRKDDEDAANNTEQNKNAVEANGRKMLTPEQEANLMYQNDAMLAAYLENQGHVEDPVSYTHLRAHETDSYLVCRLLLEKKKLYYSFPDFSSQL